MANHIGATMEPEYLVEVFGRMPPTNAWSRVAAPDQFVVQKLGHGTMAQVVRCDPKPGLDAISSIVVKRVPRAVFIKCDPLELAVINAMASQSGVAPPLLFTDQQVHVHRYIEGEHYGYRHDCDPEMVARLACQLARLHRIPVPVSIGADGGWHAMLSAIGNMPESHIFLNRSYLPMVECNHPQYLETVSGIDMVSEMGYINQHIVRIGSPIVFSHNDFNRDNRLVAAADARIYLVDFDYANYYYRGYDLGRYFSNYRHRDLFGDEGFPTDHEMDAFLVPYMDQWLLDHRPEDRKTLLQQLRLESKVFGLDAYLLDVYFGLWQYTLNPAAERANEFLEIVETRWRGYRRLKEQFQQDGTLPPLCNDQHDGPIF